LGVRDPSFSALQRAEIAEITECHRRACTPGVVSVLFNEPKLLKSGSAYVSPTAALSVSVLFNEPKLLKSELRDVTVELVIRVSVLFNEPKLLKSSSCNFRSPGLTAVSVLFNEPKLLKSNAVRCNQTVDVSFSALQRAEIAEMDNSVHISV